jgi:NAD(P)-dependent dehydrogenase (short-subunit alcohol dehydrogenase family)
VIDLSGRVALVSGAGKGAGRAIAEAFAASGARVAANDVSPINLDEVVQDIRSSGGQAGAFVEDVAKKVAVQTMIIHITDAWGRLDFLVNCANVEPHVPLLDMDEWDWHRTLGVNLTGAFLLMQSAGRVMREAGGGAIVNVAPVAGRADLPDRGAYVASKIGLVGLTRQAALELAPYNIRVYGVVTGLSELASEHEAHDDIAAAVLALCAGEAPTGQIINIT